MKQSLSRPEKPCWRDIRPWRVTEQPTIRPKRFYNLDIQLIVEADEALFEFTTEVGSQIIRTIQEALINVRKRAQVDQVVIRLHQEDDQLCISVEDQGQGFDLSQISGKQEPSSFGLQIMHERVASVGGNLEIESVVMIPARR